MRAKDAVGRYGEDVAARHLTDAGLAEPITGVHAMGSLVNRLRRFGDRDGRPRVLGANRLDQSSKVGALHRACSIATLVCPMQGAIRVGWTSSVGRAVA